MNHSKDVRTKYYDMGKPKKKLRMAKKLKADKLAAGRKGRKGEKSKKQESSDDSV